MSTYQTDNFQQSRKVRMSAPAARLSRRALAAALVGVVAWALPLVPVVVVALAVAARMAIRQAPQQNRQLRGGTLAAAGLFLGVAGLVLQGFAGYRGYNLYQELGQAPTRALEQGLGGDTAGFLAAFPDRTEFQNSADLFLIECEARYGPLVHAKPSQTPDLVAVMQGKDVTQTYRLQFTRGIVAAEAQVRVEPATGLGWPGTAEFESFTITDPARGTLRFPETRITGVEP